MKPQGSRGESPQRLPQKCHCFAILGWVCRLVFLLWLGIWKPAQAQESLPRAFANLQWDPETESFRGRALYGPHEPGPLELLHYANRHLNWSAEGRRERELHGRGFEGEDFDLADRAGSLLVENSRWFLLPKSLCTNDSLKRLLHQAPDRVQAAPLTFNLFETRSLVVVPPDQPGYCRVLALDLRVFPPQSAGNFGREGGSYHFSGPVIPFPAKELHQTEVSWVGGHTVCKGCVVSPTKTRTLQKHRAFPSPVWFSPTRSAETEVHDTGLAKFRSVGSLEGPLKAAVFEMVNSLAEDPLLADLLARGSSASRGGELFVLSTDRLTDSLSLVQFGELQLGPAFLKVNPLFEKYHRAAFMRELVILVVENALVIEGGLETTGDLRAARTLARVYASDFLRKWFQGLDDIKQISQSLSFIPLFEDILEGRALQNNRVFLGESEKHTRIDTQPFEVVVPTLSGQQVKARLSHCFSEEQQRDFETALLQLVSRPQDFQRHIPAFRFVSSQKCGYDLRGLLSDVPVEEVFQTEILEPSNKEVVAEFSRRSVSLSDTNLFRQSTAPWRGKEEGDEALSSVEKERLFFDVPTALIRSSELGRSLREETWRHDEPQISMRLRPNEFNASTEARIVGPTNGSQESRHIYPRQNKFLISGLKFRFDSAEDLAQVESGFVFKTLGDDYDRSLYLTLATDNRETAVGVKFALDLAGLFGLERGVALGSKPAPLFPWVTSLPLSVGVEELLEYEPAGSNETSAVLQLGVGNQTSDKLVPRGYSVGYSLRQLFLRDGEAVSSRLQEFQFRWSQPLGRLTTLIFAPKVGVSDEPQKLSDHVAGLQSEEDLAKEYGALRTQMQSVVVTGVNLDLLGSILFQDVMIFAAHYAAVEANQSSLVNSVTQSLQSIEGGVQIFGAFFGAKNQSLALSVSRTLSDSPENAIALTIGRN